MTSSPRTAAGADTVLRIERGHTGPEELAALTAVLLSRTATAPAAEQMPPPRAPSASWRRLERQPAFFCSHSWQA
jgi:hypothetical protein